MDVALREAGGRLVSGSLEDRLAALAQLVEQLPVPSARDTGSDAELRWRELERQIDDRVAGRRVLVIGGPAIEDAGELAARDAAYVLTCAAPAGGEPPLGLEDRIDYQPLGWQELDPARHGTFDLILCSDLVHRVTEPLTLLRTLRLMVNEGAVLLIGAMMIDDPERAEYLRFVPDRYAGDPSWWFVPGRLALRWLLQAAGFVAEAEFAEREGPRDLFPVVSAYLKAVAS